MRAFNRQMEIGDWATTDYNGGNKLTLVQIVDVDRERKHGHSQSGVMYRVTPYLKYGGDSTWYDADWFQPINQQEQL